MAYRVTIKDHIRESRLFSERAAVALAITIALIALIVARLVQLQVFGHEHFTTLSNDNRVAIAAVPPTRGLLYDRNGVLLAQNLPSFSLELIPEQIADIDATLAELGALIEIRDDDLQRFRNRLKRHQRFESIPLRFRLSESEVARFAVNRYRFPGVEIEARLTREYPRGSLAVHTIGYVGRINEDELQNLDAADYRGTSHIGKTGVERYYENLLHGKVGFQHYEVNAVGRRVRPLGYVPPVPGKNLYLTLDIELQRVAEESLGHNRGAIVAIDPRNGDVLAMASSPAYDPNSFVNGIEVEKFEALQNSKDKPLFNRSLQGQYPPGSTLKPFLGLAGLQQEIIKQDDAIFCPGWYMLKDDDRRYRDWKREGHRLTDLHKAIVESCDVYFYDLASKLGIDRISAFLTELGFGTRTRIDLFGEASGLVPSREWKRGTHGQPWFPGETLIAGIGQGFVLTTPLQLASGTAGLANGGIRMKPRIVYAEQDAGTQEVAFYDPQSLNAAPIGQAHHRQELIRDMIDVVSSPHGTAYDGRWPAHYKVAGKTGTAQVFGLKEDETYEKEEVALRLRDHALFIAFAPADEPRIAIAVVVENGGSGGVVAAPIARRVIGQYLQAAQLK